MSDINLENQLLENVSQPKSAEIDGQKVEQHSLKDQIEVDAYLAKKRAMRQNNCGLKVSKLNHSGAV